MPKVLTIIGMAVAAILLLVFTLDLALAIPFKRASMPMDIGFIICSLALAYLGWATYREQT
ncbi:MAG: hypothetical protein AB7O62_03910 [Pirellulales bacterium]